MEWARRSENEEPVMEQRRFRDDRGRAWVGSVTSGRFPGGEEHAEVLFVCEDQPSELKRSSRLDVAPAQADGNWREMADDDVLEVFRRSEPV